MIGEFKTWVTFMFKNMGNTIRVGVRSGRVPTNLDLGPQLVALLEQASHSMESLTPPSDSSVWSWLSKGLVVEYRWLPKRKWMDF
jgi:hypothetical protein